MTQRNTKSSRTRKSKKDDAIAINKEVNGKPVLGIVKEQSVTEYSSSAMTIYGSEVVEQRAIPDFRDGLKPVHRCVLWAAHQAGFKSNGPFRKSARIVGDVIGKYHPHGDGSAYDALVGVSGTRRIGQTSGWYTRNSSVPLIEGRGNFGDFIDSAAAYRYTESRLSTFSDLYMLDPDYLAVMDYVPNYDGNDKVPIVLPAKVPLILLNGYGSIAVGVAAESPPFKIEGVLKLVKLALSGKTVGPKLCAKYLVPDYPYGGTCISGPEEILELQETGKGSLRFQPSYELDRSRATMIINSACPGLMSGKTVQTLLERVAAEKLVATVDDDTGKTGVRYVIKGKRGVKDKQFDDMVQAVLKHATKSESYDVGITIRNVDGTAKFQKTTHHKILNMWVKWRIEIELKVIKRLREIQLFKQHRQELMLKAVDNLEIIIQALRVKKDKEIIRVGKEDVEVDASAAFLMRKLKVDLESANFIMDLRVRQLRLMDRNKILDQIKTHQAEVKALDRDAKQPDVRVLKQIEQLETNLVNL